MALFQQLNKERGLTVVFVTHEPDVAAFTRRTLHIRDGMINSDEVHEAIHADPLSVPALGEPIHTKAEPVPAISGVEG
jgi:putative ABC transport system ATP-binding protein